MSLQFVSTNGTTWPFDGTVGVTTINQDEGIFTIPTDLVIDQRVNGDGGVLVNQRRSPRRVVLSFFLDPVDAENILTLWSRFFSALDAGGTLIYSGPNGDRQLNQIVLEGPDRSMTGRDLQYREDGDAYTVSLLALDPWWYGSLVALSGTFGAATPWNAAIPWNSAIPWNGGASQALTVTGDAPAIPTIILVGAATTASMSVSGVGGWETAQPIPSGGYLTVNNGAARRGPHRGPHGLFAEADGPIDWSLLTEGSQLFDLPVGSSSLVFGATGTDGSTAWHVFYAPRYLTP